MVSEVSKVNKKASHASRSLDQYYQRVTVLLTSKINNKTKKELTEYGDKCFILSHHTAKSTRRECLNSSQGEINCRPSSHSDIISSQISSTNSPFPLIPDGRMEKLISPRPHSWIFFCLRGTPNIIVVQQKSKILVMHC